MGSIFGVESKMVEFILKRRANSADITSMSTVPVGKILTFPKPGISVASIESEFVSVEIPEEHVDRFISDSQENPNILSIEPNYPVEICDSVSVLNDPLIYDQAYLFQPVIQHAMEIAVTRNVTVAIVDTGVDITHPELKSKLSTNVYESVDGRDNDGNGFVDDIYGYSFYRFSKGGGSANVSDLNGHGTHLAGIIAASSNNRKFGTGINPSARILSVPFLDSTGRGTQFDAAAAIKYAVDRGAEVINCSWGYYIYSGVLQEAIDYAYAHGAIVLGAAGNDGGTTPVYPASFDHVISIGSCDLLGNRSSFSNINDAVDFLAFGDGINSTQPGNGFGRMSGTSQSTAIVSALVSRMLGAVPTGSMTMDDIVATIRPQASSPHVFDCSAWISNSHIVTQDIRISMIDAMGSNDYTTTSDTFHTVALSNVMSYPNPARTTSLTFRFDSTAIGDALIRIFDLNGRQVKSLSQGVIGGKNTVNWNLIGDNGQLVGNGTYLYIIQLTSNGTSTRFRGKLTVLL